MKKLHILALAMILSVFSLALANAQQTKLASSAAGPADTTAHKTVGFRVTEWQTKHMHDAKAAEELVASLKKVGCEVTQAAHNGHIDIRFRCPAWKLITVDNQEYAVQWSNWLKGAGMETVVEDPADTIATDTVEFRLPNWQNMHLHDAAKAKEVINMLKMVGCEIEESNHDGHIDVRFRCPEWKTIALHSHDASHHWQEWL